MSLKGRVAVVTGGARGMGRAIGLRLARKGASILVCDIDEPRAKRTAEEITRLGQEALAVKSDVSKHEDVRRAIEEAVRRFGRVDILVNNVGIGFATGSLVDPSHRLVENYTEEEWDRTINTNLKSMFLFSKEVIPYMKKQKWGKIVSISSTAGLSGQPVSGGSGPAYGAAKAGIMNLTKTLARQLGPYNVNVNAIAPGPVQGTGFTMTEEGIAASISRLPLRRIGKPEDIANAVAFLCSEDANWITGQTIAVSGGEVMQS